jgi:dihydroorotate dehydrogenase electron transfer subunit
LKQVSAIIISNIELMPGHRLVYIEAPDIAADAKPGQFITISCGRELILRRPLSIHQVEKRKRLAILFTVVGAGTQWLSQCQKNDKLDLLGPVGNGFSVQPSSQKLLLAAGGVGIAPLVFLAHKALADGKFVKLILGARTKNYIYPKKLLPEGIETLVTTEDGSYGEKGNVTDVLHKYVSWADQIYVCGPLAMYQSIAEQSKQWQGRKPIQVSLEVRMGCGVGACFSCSIKTKKGMKQVCRDGPVFKLDEVLLEEVTI